MATRFGEGRVFIVGGQANTLYDNMLLLTLTPRIPDAAHIHAPHGAQGFNSGVQDSVSLAIFLSVLYH